MRIKWNRHLDGSSSRQEGSETQEADEKKKGATSSTAIFRIFRRKKSKKRGEDDSKTGVNNSDGTVPSLLAEVAEDDNASISSVATCASQPVSEVRHRDRASSLFSSFRLSLPGSKRKKRRIAPTPSETLISEPEDDHPMERYSTPDLRKPCEKIDIPNNTQVSLSTSSPSVRNAREIPIRQTFDQNIETVDRSKSLNSSSASSNSKLSKSVSFSNRADDLNDFSHSLRDKNSSRVVRSMDMVEKNSRALESELAVCLNDNPLKNSAGKSAADGSSQSSVADVSYPNKTFNDAVVMTKTETATNGSSHAAENSISNINSILNDIASEIRSYRKPKETRDICDTGYSRQDIISSSKNCAFKDYKSEHNDGISNHIRTEVKTSDMQTSPKFLNPEMGSSMSPKQEWNNLLEVCDNNNRYISLLSKENNSSIHNSSPQLTFTENFESSLSVEPLFVNSILPKLDYSTNLDSEKRKTKFKQSELLQTNAINNKRGKKRSSSLEKLSTIENTKHVICHMRVYENETASDKQTGFNLVNTEITPENQKEISCQFLTLSNLPRNADFNKTRKVEFEDRNDVLSCFYKQPKFKPKSTSELISNVNINNSDAINAFTQNKIGGDQEVPNDELCLFKCPEKSGLNNSLPFHEVPEFELSLLEFEDMCNKYTPHRSFEFSDYNSIIPQYGESPKRKSVLDTSYSFIYPHFKENEGVKINPEKASVNDHISVLSTRIGEIKQDIKVYSDINLEDSCQSVTDKCSLPLPPKQWINCENDIGNKYNSNECNDGVQCTEVRGKNLCQEPCLEALPTIVMLDDSDLGGIDTPEVSSTLQTVQNKSGRENITDVASEILQRSDRGSPVKDMISSVSLTSTINGVLDYSCVPETHSKVYLESQINDSYCTQRTFCNVYTDVTKELEALGSKDYLTGHNFCDMRSVKLCDVINDIPCEFVQSGNGLIEISNPYQDDTYVIPHETSNQVFVNHVALELVDSIGDVSNELKSVTPEDGTQIDVDENVLQSESAVSNNETFTDVHGNGKVLSENKSPDVVINGGNRLKQNKLSYTEQKNIINKNKSSMIPCLRKKQLEGELKRTEAKSKTKNYSPGIHKNESAVQSISSRRVLCTQSKDPGVENSINKQKTSSRKYNGSVSDAKRKTEYSKRKKANQEMKLDFINVEIMVGKKPRVPEDTSGNSECILDASENRNGSNTEMRHDSVDSNQNINHIETDTAYKCSKNAVSSVVSTEDISCVPTEASDIKSDITVPEFITEAVLNRSTSSIPESDPQNSDFGDGICSDFFIYDRAHDGILSENYANGQIDAKCEDYDSTSRRSSIIGLSLLKRNFTSSKESLNSQLTSSSRRSTGKSRIPRKQPGTRGAQPSSKGPVRPPMWLSKTELTQEIQRLGTLCETRTKELNRLKMETKHVSSGFDAFAALFKYMVEDLNALSVPTLTEDLEKTLKQLELTKQDLAYYEREVEEIKSHHCQELNDLSNKLFEVYQSEVAELNAKHQEEVNHLKNEHEKQIEHLTSTFDASSIEVKAHHEKLIVSLEQEIINQREELQLFQEREIKDLEEKHGESSKMLQDHIEQLQKKCAELKQHSMSMEDAMRKDTDSKLQWVTSVKVDLQKEVESLKTVLEMKNKELHTLRVQNLEMEKQLEDLPLARERIKMLQARAEDLEALMLEKTKIERKLSTENHQMRDTYEKEAKVNRRLSMENEELQWRLRQAENSLISGSFAEEFPEDGENIASSPTKSPAPQLMSRSVFFTFVDKDESSPHSPRSQYKKITSNFSNNYKPSPTKSSPAPSPRRAKSHSEPPPPMLVTSTPKRNAKQPLTKPKGTQRRQRSGSDSSRLVSDHTEVTFSSVTESMASSVSSESSVFEHKERLLEEHKEHIIQSLEILREQRSSESADETTVIEKKWSSDDIKITGGLSKLETDDMSRSAEFADPKTYYHMTFPVLKESGLNDCDIEDNSKNVSSANSPMKEFMSNTMHSMSESNIKHAIETDGHNIQVMSKSSHEVSVALVSDEKTCGNPESLNKSCSETTVATESVQNDCKVIENRWRTI